MSSTTKHKTGKPNLKLWDEGKEIRSVAYTYRLHAHISFILSNAKRGAVTFTENR